jgi:hypothetical protein
MKKSVNDRVGILPKIQTANGERIIQHHEIEDALVHVEAYGRFVVEVGGVEQDQSYGSLDEAADAVNTLLNENADLYLDNRLHEVLSQAVENARNLSAPAMT